MVWTQQMIFKSFGFGGEPVYARVTAWHCRAEDTCLIVEKYFLYSSFWEGEGTGHARKPQQVAFLEEGTSWP